MREAEVFRSSTGALITIRWDTLPERGRTPEENRRLNEVVRSIQISAARRAQQEKKES